MSRNARAGFLKQFDVEVTARDFAQAIGFATKSDTSITERLSPISDLISDL